MHYRIILAGCGQVLRSPPSTGLRTGFAKLRANGTAICIVGKFPFVLSRLRLCSGQASTSSGQALSKHENGSFSGLLVFCLIFLAFSSWSRAQSLSPDVQPAPLIRLIGVLEAVAKPQGSAFPILRVWVEGKPLLFRVARVESVIPAYPAEERLREVSSLGLRLLAEGETLAALQSTEMHDRPIVIEGWLRTKPGVLRVRSIRLAEEPEGQCEHCPTFSGLI